MTKTRRCAFVLALCLMSLLWPMFAGQARAQGAIGGKVTSAASPTTAIANVLIEVYSPSSLVTSTRTDASGSYLTTAPLTAGNYYLIARAAPASYLDQIYSGINCPSTCASPLTGSPVTVTNGGTATANFALAPSGIIQGTVRPSGSAFGINGVNVRVYNSSGALVTTVQSNGAGEYAVTAKLGEGTYYLATAVSPPYRAQIYSGLDCGVTCPSPTTGTGVFVGAGGTRTGIDFSLTTAGFITGRVRDAATTSVLSNVLVQIYDGSSSLISSSYTDASGDYASAALPAGTYYALVPGSTDYVSQLYSSITCISCSPVTGTAISVSTGIAADRNFNLTPGGAISGRVTAANSGAKISGVTVQAYTAGGVASVSTTTDSSGNYSLLGLPVASYFVKATVSSAYVPQLYLNHDCASCSVTSGNSVSVVASGVTPSIDFAMNLTGTFFSDDPLVARVTPIRAIHITELRQRIDTLRSRYSLPTVSWTDSSIVTGVTSVKASHLLEMRTAVEQVYSAASKPVPTWAQAITARSTSITAAQLTELRTAVLAVW
jgi:hypothetical protein